MKAEVGMLDNLVETAVDPAETDPSSTDIVAGILHLACGGSIRNKPMFQSRSRCTTMLQLELVERPQSDWQQGDPRGNRR